MTLRELHLGWNHSRTFYRRWFLRALGLQIGSRTFIGRNVTWPWRNLRGISIGGDCQICDGVKIHVGTSHPFPLRIASNVSVGAMSRICALECVWIMSGTLISEGVFISDAEHIFDGRSPVDTGLEYKGAVDIGANCLIGRNVAILPGVRLGGGCIVGANAVVTKSFPSGSKIGGVPAVLLK